MDMEKSSAAKRKKRTNEGVIKVKKAPVKAPRVVATSKKIESLTLVMPYSTYLEPPAVLVATTPTILTATASFIGK